jgi:hypothetical protein
VTSVILVQRIPQACEKRDAEFRNARTDWASLGIPGNSRRFEEQTGSSAHITWLASFLAGMFCVRVGGRLDERTDAVSFGRTARAAASSPRRNAASRGRFPTSTSRTSGSSPGDTVPGTRTQVLSFSRSNPAQRMFISGALPTYRRSSTQVRASWRTRRSCTRW